MKTIVAILALLSAGISIPVRAQWAPNGAGVCLNPATQTDPATAPDGAGGLFVVWTDHRDNLNWGNTYAQHLDANGTPQWTPDGIRLCMFPADEYKPAVVSDGTGGAIVVWSCLTRSERIFAQRINSSGVLLWGDQGIPLCTSFGIREHMAVLSDGAGGAFVVFNQEDPYASVYAQRVAGNGTLLWGGNGVAVCGADGSQTDARAIADGAGGMIIAWTDHISGYGRIYAQRMNSWGSPLWTACGVPVCTDPGLQSFSVLVSNGGGGAIIAWTHYRWGPSGKDIFAQSVSADGVIQWAENGVPVCTAGGHQDLPVIIGGGAAGAIIGWVDERTGTGSEDVYAQRIDSEGNALWEADGVSVCSQPGDQRNLDMIADGAGGVIALWTDARAGSNAWDIYAQRVHASGAPAWEAAGVPVCTAVDVQGELTLLADGAGGVFALWSDRRSATGGEAAYDIYAAHVRGDGWVITGVGDTPSLGTIALMPNVPNPFHEQTSFDLILDHESSIAVDVFDVAGRRVRRLQGMHAPAGMSSIGFDGRDQAGAPLASGAYFFRVTAGEQRVTRKVMIVR